MKLSVLTGLSVLVWLCAASGSVCAAENAGREIRLLVLGDSLTAGYGLAVKDAFPEQLQQALRSAGHRVTVINAGVSGDTSAGGLSRLEWALADDPELVILELGANDALRGLSPVQTEQNLDRIIGRLTQAGVGVLLAGMRAPRNLGSDYYSKFDSLYPRLAARHNVTLYPFFLEGVAGKPGLNLDDGIHPNRAGIEVIVRKILPYVEKMIMGRASWSRQG